VSTVISPVTQDALTAVKAASMGEVNLPLLDEIGKHRMIVPTSISNAKPSAIS
jgi:hypothetical protein